jgi:dienelactone hydrolase
VNYALFENTSGVSIVADADLPKSDPKAYDAFIRAQAVSLRTGDAPPGRRKEWDNRRAKLRTSLLAAMGSMPEKPCSLAPKLIGTLNRKSYVIEKLIFQSRPDVWVTANAYVPDKMGKLPAVLCVHGHWPRARRDPVVQARCLGLMHLGFFVLAIDAFGAGERYTHPDRGTYHGALFGATLWPAGLTLLGCQVYDNRRAVDYLLTRPEVDAGRLGVTGASGGGNQTMYAGALDERLKAVVPVCSVGTYQAYLKAACCVCEVLPGALRFTEEGDVLGLVAPRALMVVSADQDAYQFSVGEAKKSLDRAQAIFKLANAADKVKHAVFESKHDYNQAMREAMYSWMARWLKDEGKGDAIAEPAHQIEKVEDLACFADPADRPKGLLFPPTLAAREARVLVEKRAANKPEHAEDWESAAVYRRDQLRKQVFGDFPQLPKPRAQIGTPETRDKIRTTPMIFQPEPELPLHALFLNKAELDGKQKVCVLLHLDGKAEAAKQPLAAALLDKGYALIAPDLRATGESKPAGDLIHDAADHNSAEHGLWIGRPLLGQWVFDVLCILDWMGIQPGLDRRSFTVAGIGAAGLIAMSSAALFEDRVPVTILIESPVSLLTESAYGKEIRMGVLAPGLLHWGDVPHLAALIAPRRLVVAAGVSPQGKKLKEGALQETLAFTSSIYKLTGSADKLTVREEADAEKLVAEL